jgi:hypothetical protein
MKLNREISKKGTVIFFILLVAFLGLLYYEVVYLPLENEMASYDTTELDSEMQLEQARAMKIKAMNEEMAKNKGAAVGIVATYNNLKNEMKALNDIVGNHADTYNFSFEDPVGSGTTVRRNMTISFTVDSYASAEDIIKQLYSCEYRLLISDMTISPNQNDNLEEGAVDVNMNVTFFETTEGADTEEGIVWEDDEEDGTSSDSSETADTSSVSSN